MNDTQITLPPEQFFWARLNAGQLPRQRRRDRHAIGYLFEAHLPVAIEQVQAAFVPLAEQADQYIACAMRTDALTAVLCEQEQTLTLVPESFPEWLNAQALSSHQFNLLHGVFEPKVLRNARRLMSVFVLAVVLTIAMLVCIGLARRASALRHEVEVIRDARVRVMTAVVPVANDGVTEYEGAAGSSGDRGGAGQPLELRMLAELRSLRQTRGALSSSDGAGSAAGAAGAESDVVESFAQLVSAWPRELHVRTESILITPTSMTLRGLASTSQDVQTLASALATLGEDQPKTPGKQGVGSWSIQQPQISVVKPDEISATLQWRRATIQGRVATGEGEPR